MAIFTITQSKLITIYYWPVDSPARSLAKIIISKQLVGLLITKKTAATIASMEAVNKAPFLPILSASPPPPSDPMTAPTKNIDTVKAQIKSIWALLRYEP